MVPYEYDFIPTYARAGRSTEIEPFGETSPLSAEVVYVQPLALQVTLVWVGIPKYDRLTHAFKVSWLFNVLVEPGV